MKKRKSGRLVLAAAVSAGAIAVAAPAQAKYGPYPVGEGVTLDPMMDTQLRYEHVDQDDAGLDADALTIRMRPGLELAFADGLSLMAEAEATLAIIEDFNSTTNGKGGQFSVVADPENIELNRLQIQFMRGGNGVTIGRQRIVLDDSRWIGNVGWRQNEQTYDAVRGQAKLGPVKFDGAYMISQRTIFGIDAGNRQSHDGNFYFASAGVDLGPVNVKAFAYLFNYDETEPRNAQLVDTQTYGLLATGKIPLGNDFALNFKASYANQSDYRNNPSSYDVDYIAAELGATVMGFGITAGYEQLGADGSGNAVQTPMATLHKFNGWADTFLTTPAGGIQDYYVTLGKKLPGVKLLPGLNASVTYHQFDSDVGSIDYGEEWNAVVGFKAMGLGVLLKYANYDADAFGTDTEKFWVQLGYAF